MSGPFGAGALQYFSGGADAFYPTEITQSLRFEDGDGADLVRTPASNGSRTTFTWSSWIKRSNLGANLTQNPYIFGFGSSSGSAGGLRFDLDDQLKFLAHPSYRIATTQVFRDTSAWYHIVIAVDTTQASVDDAYKLWVNGERITDFSEQGDITLVTPQINETSYPMAIGRIQYSGAASNYWDGYMAEIHFVDGTTYDADDFGELKSGIWIPKAPSVTYGTNGFYLDFADGAAIGDDKSGNGNDFTVNNLVASDVVPDSPTNNFCILNHIDYEDQGGDITEGGLQIDDLNSSANSYSRGTLGVTSGKWYYEVYFINAANGGHIGWAPSEFSFTSGNPFGSSIGYVPSCIHLSHTTTSIRRTDDVAPYSNSLVPGTYSQGAGVVLGVAYDADTGEIKYFLDGVAMDSGNVIVSVGEPELGWMPFVGVIGGGSTQDYSINFGQDSTFQGQETAGGNTDANGIGDFAYAPPSGYLALCTANLPDPAIDPAQEDTADKYFNVYTYTGNGASQLIGDVVREIPDTYPISQSLRFEDGDNAYLSRTPASAGNQKTWTWSAWIKRGNLAGEAGEQALFVCRSGSEATYTRIIFRTDDELWVHSNTGLSLNTSAVYRDPSAWYHIVVALDTTQATEANRCKIYVNGEQITSFATETYPSQNTDLAINRDVIHTLGVETANSTYWDGYMAEVHFIDGTAYDADTFGVFDADGLWRPINPSVTYGTNGFHLDFADSADIGDDNSGNTNDWTVNNLVATDVVIDAPTNSFTTLSTAVIPAGAIVSEGNLAFYGGSSWEAGVATTKLSSGKWYWEVRPGGVNCFVGVIAESEATTLDNTYPGAATATDYYSFGYYGSNGRFYDGVTNTALGTTFNQNTTVGIAFDADIGQLEFFVNNVSQFTYSHPNLYSLTWQPAIGANIQTHNLNFGQDSTFNGRLSAAANADGNGYGEFQYAPPSGFLALCENNLIQYDDNPLESPDFVWIKARVNRAPRLYDSVRGVGNGLISNATNAEAFDANGLTGFHKNGFTVGSTDEVNYPGNGFVAWTWKAGGTGVSNTNGSITSTVSANTDAGFSIVGYTGTQVAGDTVGHGLTQAPEMIIVKKRGGAASDWTVYHKDIASDAETDYVELNNANILIDGSDAWNDTAPTSTVFSLGNGTQTNDNSGGGVDHIAYCFHSVDQYSKCGVYTGNGSANGTFVYTGFRPKFLLTKNVSGATADWRIYDSERLGYNASQYLLVPNTSAAELASTEEVDFLSNGFKCRDTDTALNTNGVKYIYLAIAEQPFKYSNAR